MSSMHLKLTSLTMAFLFFTAASARANEFEYFSKGIDFWSEKPGAPSPQKTAPVVTEPKTVTQSTTEGPKKEGFEWGTYMDPKNKEFFREGDYTPPEPFMELVRNPSDANMKMWFAYMEKKNELQTRLQEKMAEYLAKNGQSVPREDREKVAALSPVKLTNIDPKRYRVRMYFNSTCPHCKRMFGTLSELQTKGFFVEAKQLDRENAQVRTLPFPVDLAALDEAKQKNIQSVPLLLIGDLKKQVVYRLTGFQPTNEVLKAIQGQNGQ